MVMSRLPELFVVKSRRKSFEVLELAKIAFRILGYEAGGFARTKGIQSTAKTLLQFTSEGVPLRL